MKIRIRGNSVRLRLTKSEVDQFGKEGYIEESTDFGATKLTYALSKTQDADMSASFENNKINMFLPESKAQEWTSQNIVGFDHKLQLDNGTTLSLLLEKDFKCLDESTEDQSDNYDNPLLHQH